MNQPESLRLHECPQAEAKYAIMFYDLGICCKIHGWKCPGGTCVDDGAQPTYYYRTLEAARSALSGIYGNKSDDAVVESYPGVDFLWFIKQLTQLTPQ